MIMMAGMRMPMLEEEEVTSTSTFLPEMNFRKSLSHENSVRNIELLHTIEKRKKRKNGRFVAYLSEIDTSVCRWYATQRANNN